LKTNPYPIEEAVHYSWNTTTNEQHNYRSFKRLCQGNKK